MPADPVPPTARALAEQVAAAIPHHTFMDWMNEGVMPDTADAHGSLCSRCGRRLPCSVASQSGQEGVWIPASPEQRVVGCLVDGPRAAKARRFTADELIVAAGVVADGAEHQGWKATARFLRHALAPEGDIGTRVERSGQALEAVRVYGLFSVVTMRTGKDHHPDVFDAAIEAQRDLDVLVASGGPYWPIHAR